MPIPARLQPFLFAAIGCVGLSAFGGYDLFRERDRAVVQAKANTANLARLLQADMRQNLRRVESTLTASVAATARMGNGIWQAPTLAGLAALRADLKTALPGDGLVESITWFAPDGSVILSTDPATTMAGVAEAFQRTATSQGGPGGNLLFAAPRSGQGGRRVMSVGLRHDNGDPAGPGLWVARVNLGSLQPVLDAVDTGRNGFVTLFLLDGWMLATAPNNDALFAKNWFETPMFQEHLPQSRANTVQQVVVRDGTERIYSYRALPDYPVVVSAGISLTDALADWRARVRWDALLLVLASAASLLGAWTISRNYVRREAAESAAVQAREAAENSERFLRAITDNLPTRIAYSDRALRYRFVNRTLADHLAMPRDAILGRTRDELIGQRTPPEMQRRLDAALAGRAQHFEIEEQHDGQARCMETHLIPDIDADGATQGFYWSSTDVTQRLAQQRHMQESLAERETLLREVYHRVKNNLQVIQSLLNLQWRALPQGPARDALEESMQRVHAMALVHEKLYQTGNLQAVDLREYTTELLAHLAKTAGAHPRGIVVELDIEPLQASLETAVPYGLLVTELVGNSFKHGFVGDRTGTVQVRLRHEGGVVRLVVRDDGQGLPERFDPAAADSMGLQLAASLATQLGGTLSGTNDGGAVFSADLERLA
jgi:PAS domain S-box-containing protein